MVLRFYTTVTKKKSSKYFWRSIFDAELLQLRMHRNASFLFLREAERNRISRQIRSELDRIYIDAELR